MAEKKEKLASVASMFINLHDLFWPSEPDELPDVPEPDELPDGPDPLDAKREEEDDEEEEEEEEDDEEEEDEEDEEEEEEDDDEEEEEKGPRGQGGNEADGRTQANQTVHNVTSMDQPDVSPSLLMFVCICLYISMYV